MNTKRRSGMARWAVVTAIAAVSAFPATTAFAAPAADPAQPISASAQQDQNRLMINGDRPVSKQQGDVHAYVHCAGGIRPGALHTQQLGMPGDWYQVDGDNQGYWGKLTVINAAGPGTYSASVDCGSSTATSEFHITE